MRGESDVAEFEGAVGAAPSDAELERTILSVPGVADASVHRHADGRSRLRLRLHPGEDAEPVSWAVAATLRERFAIALDPKAIRQVVDDASTDSDDVPTDPGDGPTDPGDLSIDADDGPTGAPDPSAPPPPPVVSAETAATDTRPDADADPAAGTSAAPADASSSDPSGPATPDRSTGTPAPTTSEPSEPSAETAETADTATPPAGGSAVDPAAPATLSEPRSGDPIRLLGPEFAGSGHKLAPRAAIHHLDVQRGEAGVRVTATLGHDGRRADGSATAVATSIGVRRAVAEATVSAMRSLLGGSLLIGVDHVAVRSGEDPALATAVLTWLTDRGEETLVGTSLLRSDPEQAVMRATLDALNRRVEPLLVSDTHLPR